MLTGEEMRVQQGDIFYLPQGLQYHSYWESATKDSSVAEWESYGFHFFPNSNETCYKMQILHCDQESISYLDQLNKNHLVSPSSVGWLYLFLGKILPQMEEEIPDPRAQLLTRAKQFMLQNPDFKVGDLARYCGISESGLYAFFRNYAKTTPIAMKNQMKVENAIGLLSSTDLSIEEISDSLKFSSPAYFRKVVKEQTGKTPSALRRENKISDLL
jgi:AraC-like DNA-binding protein